MTAEQSNLSLHTHKTGVYIEGGAVKRAFQPGVRAGRERPELAAGMTGAEGDIHYSFSNTEKHRMRLL